MLKSIPKWMDISKLRGDKVIWVIILLLALTSLALVYSSSSSLAFKNQTTNFSVLVEQLVFLLAGLFVIFCLSHLPLKYYRGFTNIAFIATLVLVVITIFAGETINGARRTLRIGPITVQSAEMVKITLILYLSRAFESKNLEKFSQFALHILAPIAISAALVMVGSVSAALFLGVISFIIILIAKTKISHILKTIGIGILGFAMLLGLHSAFGIFPRVETATGRITRFFEPKKDSAEMTVWERQAEADKMFQANMAELAISSVGVLGKGPGKSTQRYLLPLPYSDYIFAIIIEEYGLIGGAAVVMLYLWFLYRCFVLVRYCKKKYSALAVGGLGIMIVSQAFVHIFVNVGIFPVTGHTLPLISQGGTSILILCGAFGIILSVSRTIDMSHEKAKLEAIRLEEERLEAERLELERIEAERLEIARLEAEEVDENQIPENQTFEIIESNGEFK